MSQTFDKLEQDAQELLETLVFDEACEGRLCNVYSPRERSNGLAVYRCEVKALIRGRMVRTYRDYTAGEGWQAVHFSAQEYRIFMELSDDMARLQDGVELSRCGGK